MSFAERLAEVQAQIASACQRAGRAPASVNLLVVSKFQPESAIEEAYASGLRNFGESYSQELSRKRAALAHLGEARWHLIGHLQTNKVKQALQGADVFQAVDSIKILTEIGKRSRESQRTMPWPVYLQVNLDNESGKAGVPSIELEALARAALAEPTVTVQGLMCIPEPKTPAEKMRPAFRELRRLATALEPLFKRRLELSMGMSDDFSVAIEEGADWIRVGSKLFGERPQKR